MGDLSEINDIKTAICLFFSRSGELNEAVADEKITGFIGYFGYAAAKAELLSGGFLEKQNEGIKITDKGREWAETFGGSIDFTIRERIFEEADRLRLEAEKSKICRVTMSGDKHYYVDAEIGDEAAPVMNLRLFAPDEKNAVKLRKAIESDPLGIYKRIIAVIEKTGD
jgi:hypothetical protein